MTLSGILALVGLAALDALNPFSVAALAYLLGTDRPFERGTTFIVASFIAYYAGGIVLLQGWLAFAESLLPRFPVWTLPALEISAGAACLIFAARMFFNRGSTHVFRPPSQLGLPGTFAFGVINTLADLPTAVPLFAAVGQIATTDGVAGRLAWLALYVAIYVSPLGGDACTSASHWVARRGLVRSSTERRRLGACTRVADASPLWRWGLSARWRTAAARRSDLNSPTSAPTLLDAIAAWGVAQRWCRFQRSGRERSHGSSVRRCPALDRFAQETPSSVA